MLSRREKRTSPVKTPLNQRKKGQGAGVYARHQPCRQQKLQDCQTASCVGVCVLAGMKDVGI